MRYYVANATTRLGCCFWSLPPLLVHYGGGNIQRMDPPAPMTVQNQPIGSSQLGPLTQLIIIVGIPKRKSIADGRNGIGPPPGSNDHPTIGIALIT